MIKNNEELKEYVCWIGPTNELNLSRYNKARSQTVWAKNPTDAEEKLAYLLQEDSSIKIKCLYSMEEFNSFKKIKEQK